MDDEIIQPEILIPPNITLPPDIELLFHRTKRKFHRKILNEDWEREIYYRNWIKYVNGIPERESYLWYAPEYSGGLHPSEEDRILRATPTIVEWTIPHPKKPGESLKVGYIESLTWPSGSNIQRIHYKLLEAIRSWEYDIIVAPEYSYCTPGYEEILSKEDIDRYMWELCDANKWDTLVIPGSCIWKDDRYSIHNSSPVIVWNKIIEIHDKMLQAGYDKDIVNHENNKITIQINELQDKILELRWIRDRLQTTGWTEWEISEIETQILMIESRIREIKFHKYRIVRTPTPELDREIDKLEKTVQHLLEWNNPLKDVLLRRIFDQIESLKELREKTQFLSDDIEWELLQLHHILAEYTDIIQSYKISGFDASNFEILAQNIKKKDQWTCGKADQNFI